MGQFHARNILEGKIARCELAGIYDPVQERLRKFPALTAYSSSQALADSDEVDAVLIVTPHYGHTTIGIEALQAGKHVLVEKPISVHKGDAERLIRARKDQGQVFAAMFNLRTDPRYQKVKQLLTAGELGALRRVNWVVTDWFRSDAYYRSSPWRATWAGEGGGVLMNQCLHNLDLWQWFFGMPKSVRAFCRFGRYHEIEVEDDVTAYLEYSDGTTGVLVTATGEAPGANRLEIVGERGRLTLEDGNLRFKRNEIPMADFARTSPELFATPPVWDITVPVAPGGGSQHVGILNNFVSAILDGAPLIAPAEEGLNSVELANAMILSSVEGKTVELPLDSAVYEALLQRLIVKSSQLSSGRGDSQVSRGSGGSGFSGGRQLTN
jgi:predicted dehydrogenase